MSYYGMKKKLKDFPVGEWIRAAGICGMFDDEDSLECEAKVEVKIENPGNENAGFMRIRCDYGHSQEDLVGWTVADEPVSLGAAGHFYPLTGRSNHAYCAACGLIVVEVPLILWGRNAPDKVDWELNFCWSCARKLNLLNLLRTERGDNERGPRPQETSAPR